MAQLRSMLYKLIPGFQITMILVWLSNLSRTDSYFSIYAIIAFAAGYLILKQRESVIPRKEQIIVCVLSIFFSCGVLLANYPLFTTIGDPAVISRSTSLLMNLIDGFLTLVGGISVSAPVLKYAFLTYPGKVRSRECGICIPGFPVWIFLTFVVLNLIHLMFVEYPGNMTEDTFTQISEMVSGSYSNFNTFWHTMILRGGLSLGYILFSDLNAAFAFFCVIQILLVSFAFTYSLMTLRQYGVSNGFFIAVFLVYAIVPYNIALSITIWKDVLFAIATLLVISSWLRITLKIGKRTALNYAVFGFGSILYFMARTNGWVIYLVTFLLYAVFNRRNKKFLAVMGALAVFGWALLNPILSAFAVDGSDPVEDMSVPIQQVSRVIADGCDLTEEEKMLLEAVVDLEEVPALYTNWLSDPMKIEVRSKNYEYFLNNIDAYRNLWIKLGLRYPWEYVKAWVDQTRGYWNGGYDYALYSETVTENPYGVEKSGGNNPVASLFRLYFGLSRHLIFFEPLHSIGLHVWIVFLCLIVNIAKKREVWFVALPVVLLVVGLWFGTPVYSCFRYAYPLFVCFPVILGTTLYLPKQ